MKPMLARVIPMENAPYPELDDQTVIVFDRVGDHNFFGCITMEGRIVEVGNLRLRIIGTAPESWYIAYGSLFDNAGDGQPL